MLINSDLEVEFSLYHFCKKEGLGGELISSK